MTRPHVLCCPFESMFIVEPHDLASSSWVYVIRLPFSFFDMFNHDPASKVRHVYDAARHALRVQRGQAFIQAR